MYSSELHDHGLVAGLSRPDLLEIYHSLALTRSCESRLEILSREGLVLGETYRSFGQEAGAVAAASVLRRRDDGTGDLMAPTRRGWGAMLMMGADPVDFFRQYLERATGPTGGRDGGLHWGDLKLGFLGPVSPLGVMVQVMAGICLSFQVRGEDRAGLAFCGDPETATGACHEGLAFAASQRCPLVLHVEANFAVPPPAHPRAHTRVESFTEKAAGYGLHATSVDGTDVLAVVEGTRGAVARARAGEGVGMVELRYLREPDPSPVEDLTSDPQKKVGGLVGDDPLLRYRDRLLHEGWASEEALDGLDTRAQEEAERAAKQALRESLSEGRMAVDGVYSGMTANPPWTRRTDPSSRLGREVVSI